MENDLFNITLNIAGRTLSPQVKRSDEALFRNAANYVDTKLSTFIRKHPKQDMVTYLSLASLELAIELLKNKAESESVYQRIEALEKELGAKLR